MTISEALRASKKNGKTYTRANSDTFPGWIKYHPTHRYEDLSAEDLMADDWELSSVYVEKLAKGKWTTAE